MKLLTSTGKLVYKTWAQPQAFAPSKTHGTLNEKLDVAMPVSERKEDNHPNAGGEKVFSPPVVKPAGGDPSHVAPNKNKILPLSEEERKAKRELTHTLYDPQCPVCQSAKARVIPHRRKLTDDSSDLQVKKFGDFVTADHVDACKNGLSLKGDNAAIIIADIFAKVIRGYPRASRNLRDTVAALQDFIGPGDTVGLFSQMEHPFLLQPPRH